MADAGANQYTFHIEPVIKDVLPLCRKIREAGMKVGLALKPGTGIEAVRQYINHADMILIMTVEPGIVFCISKSGPTEYANHICASGCLHIIILIFYCIFETDSIHVGDFF